MTPKPPPATSGRSPGLLLRILGLFESVWFGVTLLALLFVYSSIGSAGILYWTPGEGWVHEQLRQRPFFEMTEFEWFHWWPFDLLIGLICINLTVVTLRRIKLSVVNLGVWMIHAGVILLCIGSVIYFSTKVEGDAPVVRREIQIRLPTGEVGSLVAMPGNATVIGTGNRAWGFQVQSTDPEWELLTGDDAGETTYSVTVAVQGPGTQFMRQLLVGYPEYTEDIIPSGRSDQPMVRAVKELGRPLVDDQLELTLEPLPTEWFYLANWVQKSWALYVREAGQREWSQRPIDDLPLYNDYVPSREEVWLPDDSTVADVALDLAVESFEPGDPLADIPVRITSYLRYAQMESRRLPGGTRLDPWASIVLDDGVGETFEYEMEAFDGERSVADGGFVRFAWARTEEEREELGRLVEPRLTVSIPGTDVEVSGPIRELSLRDPDLEWIPVPETDYEYRVEFVEDRLELGNGRAVAMASVEVRTPERTYRRWVFDDPSLDRDVSPAHDHSDGEEHDHDHSGFHLPEEILDIDPGISMRYQPGNFPAPVMVIAGPAEDDLGISLNLRTSQDGVWQPVAAGEAFSLGGGATLTVDGYASRSRLETRPLVVPLAQRVRELRARRAMVQVRFAAAGETHTAWVPFHHYAFRDRNETLMRNPYGPATVQLGDGRRIELMLSRQRLPLPAPVVLDDFAITAHVGGFSGRTSSIRNWTSMVRFADGERGWTDPVPVSVNAPVAQGELSFFQSEWDPPTAFEGVRSGGLNYTVLGVGNRHGVVTQLLGCTIAVIGMIYAFYVKPLLRRRRGGGGGTPVAAAARREARSSAPAPVGVLAEEQV